MIDLRSDTVTRPTPAMRRAMRDAEVGDDAYGEDPTVNRLQQRAAAIVGKEAALFVPTGTMGNQIAIAVHATPGSEVICEERAHVVEYELASMAVISGCMPRTVFAPHGVLDAAGLERRLRPRAFNQARPGVIVIENTHNLASGAVTPAANMKAIGELGARHGIPVHVDGARIFNAAAALGTSAAKLVEGCDSLMFCLSKGLCAPVGSLLVGTSDFIERARRWRRRLGGGMRQAGVLAAAGLIALEQMRERLVEDHEKAAALVEGVDPIAGLESMAPTPITNIVYVRVHGDDGTNLRIAEALKEEGVLCNVIANDRLRFVTHHDVTRNQITDAIRILARVAAA